MQEYPVRLLREMLETYSPSGSERAMATLVRREMDSLGFNSRIDHTGNVTGEIGDKGPRILFCGHMDTVPGHIPVRIENDFLYGRGAVDAKSSLAAMMIGIARAVKERGVPIQAELASVVEEETTSKGFRGILANGETPYISIFGEPSGLANIIIGYKGRVHLSIECKTEGGHSASPWVSRNSAEEAFQFWTDIRNSLLGNHEASKFNSLTGSLTGVMTTGPENSIPSYTKLSIDIRTPPETEPDHIVTQINSLANRYSTSHPGVGMSISVGERTRPYESSPHSKLVAAFRGAIRKVTTDTATVVRKTGTSDMNLLSTGAQAIAYGPGDSRLDHTDNERVSISEYLKSIDVYVQALKLLSNFAEPVIEVPA